MMRDEKPLQRTIVAASSKTMSKPAGASTSVFDLAAAQKTPTIKRGPRLFDVGAIKIESGVAVPPKVGGQGGISQYALLFSRMKPGDVAWLERQRAAGFIAWLRKAGKPAELRQMPDGGCGVWLQGTPPPSAAKKAVAPGKGSKR